MIAFTRCACRVLIVILCLVVGDLLQAQSLHYSNRSINVDPSLGPLDIRWAGEGRVLIAAGRKGIWNVPLSPTGRPAVELAGGGSRGSTFLRQRREGFFFAALIARSNTVMLAASPFESLAWTTDRADWLKQFPFASIVDVDVWRDRVAILGSQRDSEGRWAPEGAIVWTGSFDRDLADLSPLKYGAGGPGSPDMGKCYFMDLGVLRFGSDGSLLVVPGVEPGVEVYDRSGRVLRRWETSGLGFVDHCFLSTEQVNLLVSNPRARWQWKNRQTIVDDALFLRGQPALFLRRHEDGKTRWEVLLLPEGKKPKRFPVPIISDSPYAHLRVDAQGDQVVALLLEHDFARTTSSGKIVMLEYRP
jgi:hypothetical protein